MVNQSGQERVELDQLTSGRGPASDLEDSANNWAYKITIYCPEGIHMQYQDSTISKTWEEDFWNLAFLSNKGSQRLVLKPKFIF